MKFLAAAVQFHPALGDFEVNVSKMEGLFSRVAQQNPQVRLIVMPELATTGYEAGARFFELAEEPPDGPSIRRMGELCRRHRVHLVYGFAERDQRMRDVLYNSAALIDEEGRYLGAYRKVHLFAGEKSWFRPGCGYPLFPTRLGRIGVFICWDAAFPEPARIYAVQGADLLVVATNYEKPYAADWDLMTAARAFDNTLHLVAANRFGRDKEYDFFGHSRILDPLGRVISKLDEEVEGFITGEIDTDLTVRLRQEYYTFMKDRRPDTYGELTRPY